MKNGNKSRRSDSGRRISTVYVLAWVCAGLAISAVVFYSVLFWRDINSSKDAADMLLQQMHVSVGDLLAGTVGICLSFSATLFMFVTFREQRRQFEAGRRDADKDRFENTFFNMLAMLYKVRENAEAEINRRTDGRIKGMQDFYEGFRSYYLSQCGRVDLREVEAYLLCANLNLVEREKGEQVLGELYEEYLAHEKCDIGYYYRYVFNTINFVVDHWKGRTDGREAIASYLNMLQAQMADFELGLIFYDAVSRRGLDKNYEYRFKNRLDTFNFLENIGSHTLFSRSHHHLYPHTIFRFLNRDERAVKIQR